MSDKIIKSGEEIVNEFFEKILIDEELDRETRKALFLLQMEGNFKRAQIEKKLDSIRDSAMAEDGKAKENQT